MAGGSLRSGRGWIEALKAQDLFEIVVGGWVRDPWAAG